MSTNLTAAGNRTTIYLTPIDRDIIDDLRMRVGGTNMSTIIRAFIHCMTHEQIEDALRRSVVLRNIADTMGESFDGSTIDALRGATEEQLRSTLGAVRRAKVAVETAEETEES